MDADKANEATSTPEIRDGDNPLDSRFDDWDKNPEIDRARLVERAMRAAAMNAAKSHEQKPEPKQPDTPDTKSSATKHTQKRHWWRRSR